MRISRAQMFMMMARAASMRSTCSRLNVGAVITHNNRPLSVGWNGAGPGEAHCAGNDCPGTVPGRCPTLHAEHNAIINLPSIPLVDLDLYVTHSPCAKCCEAIKMHPMIKRVFFEVPYRSTQHLGMLSAIDIYEVTPAGYVVDYFTRQVIEKI